ncbi:hypothetical protein [Klebsiella sp. w6]|uniref:hypothetical protein n=1 Tax=Klebsiella sp. w6 TaxID=3081203 RepID=UPI002954CFDB|nr:hypothetical protein [Klebsiella sp. w6]
MTRELTDERIDALLEKVGVFTIELSQDLQDIAAALEELQERRKNQQTRALVMWIKRLSLALRSASPDNKLPKAAMGYLQNNGLISIADCLRGNNEEPPA